MAVQNGRDLLIRMDVTGDGSFQTIAGLRATRLAFNAESVDVTSLESQGGWRELLAGAGVRSASISGAGVFRDEATDARVRQVFFDGAMPRCQVVIPSFGVVEGPFQISGLEYAGTHDGEATYEITLASAGALSFVADADEMSAMSFVDENPAMIPDADEMSEDFPVDPPVDETPVGEDGGDVSGERPASPDLYSGTDQPPVMPDA